MSTSLRHLKEAIFKSAKENTVFNLSVAIVIVN